MGTKGEPANLSQLGFVSLSWERDELEKNNEETRTYLETLFASGRTGLEAFGNVFKLFTFIISFP